MRSLFALFIVAGAALATGFTGAGFQGTWDATILAVGDLVPFRLEVGESPARVCFFEDTQPVCATSARIDAGKLIAQWDYLGRELRLEVTGGGLQGAYHSLRTGSDLAVQAKPHQQPPNTPHLARDLAGEWEIHSKEDPALAWQLLLRQTGHDLKGTILRVDGDDGTLVGTVANKHFLISHFSGDRPVLLEGTLADGGSLDLKFEGGSLFALRPAAARARNLAPPPDPATFARAKDPKQPFQFRLPDLSGRIYTEADFRGKPLVISITGSWCPNCRDEAPFLAELYQRYHTAGLELAAFCFEPADDTDHPQLRAFLRRFAIRYPALLAGDPSDLKTVVSQIDNLSAFPTTIYIGKDGGVRAVHTGFPSAASGEELPRVKREINELVERMIAEPPAQPSGQTVEDRLAELNRLLAGEWEYTLRTQPELATHVGDDRYNDRLSDFSDQAIAAELEHARQSLSRFEAIDVTGFPEQEKLNRALMLRSLREALESTPFKDWEMPATQFDGVHLGYASLALDTPFRNAKDYQDYLSRLRQIPRVLDQAMGHMRDGLRDHRMPPRYLLEKVSGQAQEIAGYPLDKSPFTAPLGKFPDSISEAERRPLREGIESAVRDLVAPAYAKFAKFVREDYAPHGRLDPGVWALPDGQARYRFAVRHETTSDFTAEQIHQLGLKSVGEIETEMLIIAKTQGFGDLKSFNDHIRQDPKLHARSGRQLLDLYTGYRDQMYGKLPELFGRLPKTKLDVVPMEAFRSADSVPADYSPGAGDGARPGRINVNEYAPEKRLLLNVEAIAYHEGVPGHHLQFSIAQELTGLPPFRRYDLDLNAYTEGWAFYAERLGKEVGFYQDPYSDYGRLQNEMWRAVRWVVDTGVHAKHWTRQQMIDFFHQHTAMDDQNIETEVDRYIAWPAQALSYKMGQMKILALRERAQRELGAKFDLRAFHDAVLDQGPLPLDMLQAKIDAWIASRR